MTDGGVDASSRRRDRMHPVRPSEMPGGRTGTLRPVDRSMRRATQIIRQPRGPRRRRHLGRSISRMDAGVARTAIVRWPDPSVRHLDQTDPPVGSLVAIANCTHPSRYRMHPMTHRSSASGVSDRRAAVIGTTAAHRDPHPVGMTQLRWTRREDAHPDRTLPRSATAVFRGDDGVVSCACRTIPGELRGPSGERIGRIRRGDGCVQYGDGGTHQRDARTQWRRG